MSGGSASRDVPPATMASGGFAHSAEAKEAMSKRIEVHPPVLMKNNRIIVCQNDDIDCLVVDGTGSMGNWSYTYHDKSDRNVGQVRCQAYVDDPAFNLTVIGDANPARSGGRPDTAPIQMTEFATTCPGVKDLLGQLWIEGGGGGQAKESYELAMYGYARKVKQTGKRKGWLTFLGDEGFYEVIKAEHLRRHFGEIQPVDIPTGKIIEELKAGYNILALHISTHNPDANNAIVMQWREAFGDNFVDITEDPKSLVDFRLGFMALKTGSRDLDGYCNDMREQEQTERRIDFVMDRIKAANWQPENMEVKQDTVQL